MILSAVPGKSGLDRQTGKKRSYKGFVFSFSNPKKATDESDFAKKKEILIRVFDEGSIVSGLDKQTMHKIATIDQRMFAVYSKMFWFIIKSECFLKDQNRERIFPVIPALFKGRRVRPKCTQRKTVFPKNNGEKSKPFKRLLKLLPNWVYLRMIKVGIKYMTFYSWKLSIVLKYSANSNWKGSSFIYRRVSIFRVAVIRFEIYPNQVF